MCLAIPGQLMTIDEGDPFQRKGDVSFDGLIKEVSLICVPEAKIGDYVLVHVGLAISIVDEEQAQFIFDYLQEAGELEELKTTKPGDTDAIH
jgi:hydrogenase expression/formation protein HypC